MSSLGKLWILYWLTEEASRCQTSNDSLGGSYCLWWELANSKYRAITAALLSLSLVGCCLFL